MFQFLDVGSFLGVTIIISVIIGIWEIIWKGIGLWHASKDNKKGWFIAILVFNTAGILPLIYIYLIRKRKKAKK